MILAQHLSFLLKPIVMKKLIPLSIFTIVILASCYRDHNYNDPIADFSVNTAFAQPNERIYFNNHSLDATSYYWDFGDGQTSIDINPAHTYRDEGTYTITLTAENYQGGRDVARITVEVYYTQLEITVAEWNEAYVIDNKIPYVNIRLYGSMYDWDNEINIIAEGTTDRYGVIVFEGLEPVSYYIDAYSVNYNNFSIRADLPDLISTNPLVKSMTNTFTAWVDYAPSSSIQAGRLNKSAIKIKRSPAPINKNEIAK
jgi:PKD repeat protein